MRIILTAVLLATAAPLFAQPLPRPTAQTGESVEDLKLKTLFWESDEAGLKRHPISALYRGDLRYADRVGEFFTDEAVAEDKRATEADLTALRRIDRAKLTHIDQIAYDVFKTSGEIDLRGYAPDILRLMNDRPLDHFYGVHLGYADLSSGQGAAPFRTLVDYQNALKRHAQFAAALDLAIGRFRQGMKDGIVHPKLIVNNMIAQLDTQIGQGVKGSIYYGPVTKFPDSISAADQARLKTEYAAMIRDNIAPALTRLRDFLKNDYLPVARDSVGLSAMPGGAKLYDYLIEANTTLPMHADEVHRLGLSEVARIRQGMEAQKTAVGFKGSLPDFFTFLRTDPQFAPKTKEQLRDGYFAIGRRVDQRVREQFSLIPTTPLEIRPVPEYKEKTEAGGSYNGGTPDGSRPGVFYYNGYDLPSRYMWEMETLYLHEAVPGHHFQISLAQENKALPAFMRFGGNTAYAEGWGLYAETLWRELGVETDPYQRMGGLNDEMLRAMRLVVDTGLHTKNWSRDQAITYMLDNSPMSRTDATAEVERYIAIPGQALAYKIGQLTISRTKARAQAALGDRFDPRAFHAQVLDTGALPMPVLESKIDAWVAAGGK